MFFNNINDILEYMHSPMYKIELALGIAYIWYYKDVLSNFIKTIIK